jgi:RNA polymerase sigma-70 factor (ECF subfamily)
MGLTLRMIQDKAVAEEIVQETFWRVWRYAHTFQAQRGSFTSWLFSLAHRLAIDTWRRQKVRPQPARSESELQQMYGQPDPQATIPEAVWLLIQHEQVRAAVAELPPEQLHVIELAYFQGLTRQEIAQITGLPLGTIHTRARLALQKLRAILHQEDESQ